MVYPTYWKVTNVQKFNRLYSIMTGFQNDCWISFLSMTPNFVVVVNILLPGILLSCWLGMPNLRIFVEDIVALLVAMTD